MPSKHWWPLLFIFLAMCQSAKEPYPTTGAIEVLDEALHELVSPDAQLEILSEGHDWTEGPLWIPDRNFLLFSDIPPNRIYRWQEGLGTTVYLEPSGYTGTAPRGGEVGSNGLVLDHQGRLVLAQHGDRRIARLAQPIADNPTAEYETLADRFDGMRFNSPNDLVYHSSGDVYFTDPPYGLEMNMDDPQKELDFQGVYRLTPDGSVTLLESGMSRPNGLAFSPDESTLYVANSDPDRPVWMAFSVLEDGMLSDGRVFFDATHLVDAGRRGLPDGLKIDVQGNLFATGPGGVLVISPEGRHLGTLMTGQATSNCAFGDDGSTLYITADMYLMRIRLSTRG